MALTKDEKQQVVDEVANLLTSSKLTVAAAYSGTSVKALQELRRSAKANGTVIKVIKNRLVVKAISSSDALKSADTSQLKGQLLYAFNADDEVASAQSLATFAKKNPSIEFVGGISQDGQFIERDDIKALAALPSKEQLRGQLVGTIAAPLSGFMNVLSGNIRGVLNVLSARAEIIK